MRTAREEIIDTLRANNWQVGMRAGAVIGSWRRRRIACVFDSTGRITAANVAYPLDRNEGRYTGPLPTPLRAQALAFIRGEQA